MNDTSVFETLFEDEQTSVEELSDGGYAFTVQNREKDAPLAIYFRPQSAYPYTVSFEGVSCYFVSEGEAFDHAAGIYDGSLAVLNFYSHGESRLRYAFPFDELDLRTTVEGFAASAAGDRPALSGIIAALVEKGNCYCRLRTWDGAADQSIILAL